MPASGVRHSVSHAPADTSSYAHVAMADPAIAESMRPVNLLRCTHCRTLVNDLVSVRVVRGDQSATWRVCDACDMLLRLQRSMLEPRTPAATHFVVQAISVLVDYLCRLDAMD